METRTETARPVEGRSAPPPAGRPPDEPKIKVGRGRPPLWMLLLGAIVVIAVLIWGIRYLAYATTHETTDDARIDGDTVTITSKIAERIDRILVDTNDPVSAGQVLIRLDDRDERARLTQAQAAVQAQREAANAAQQTVALTREQQAAQATEGTGGVSSATAQIHNAQATYDAATQQIGAARAAVGQSQAQLRVAQAQVPSTRSALDRANADLARITSLVRTGDVAVQQLDAQRATQAMALAQYQAALDQVTSAETGVTQAQARLTGAIASANAALAGIGAQQGQFVSAQGKLSEAAAPARVPAAQAQAQAAQAQVTSLQGQEQTARDQLGYTVIRSPIAGVIGEKNIAVGAAVSPGQSLLQIIPGTGIFITANYKETQLGLMKPGQEVDISVDAYKGVAFRGRVESIGPASQNTFSLIPAQNATGNFVKVTQRLPVRIVFVDPPKDKPLRVGMSVETSVRVK